MRADIAVTLLALTALSACQFIPGTDASKERAAEKGMADMLVDPSSAQFRNVSVRKGVFDRVSVCGEVNGKNRMGAYAGYTRFFADPNYPSLGQVEDTNPTTPAQANERLANCQSLPGASCTSEVSDLIGAQHAAEFDGKYESACNGVPTAEEKAIMKKVGLPEKKPAGT